MKTVRLVLLLALSSACAAYPTSPDQAAPVRLTATIDRTQIGAGQTAIATFRVDNTTSEQITLSFASGCQVLPFIVKRASNDIVYPSGGGWMCTTVLTQMVLPPQGSAERQVKVAAGATLPDHVTLPAGEYGIYATLDDSKYKLKSEQVSLTVQ